MSNGIHPDYVVTTVTCSCGESFATRSTAKNGVIHADVCSSCHPFYTGKQKILDTGGRVARFERRFGKKQADKARASSVLPLSSQAKASKGYGISTRAPLAAGQSPPRLVRPLRGPGRPRAAWEDHGVRPAG